MIVSIDQSGKDHEAGEIYGTFLPEFGSISATPGMHMLSMSDPRTERVRYLALYAERATRAPSKVINSFVAVAGENWRSVEVCKVISPLAAKTTPSK